ncbi:hypothetical protein TKK_0001621 [Trichogramma kaykai]
MAPNTKITHKKKERKPMTLSDKIKVLDLLKNGEIVAAVARKFDVNESTIRTIRKNKEKIFQSVQQLGQYAKQVKTSRNVNLEKMEEMLILWIQDVIRRNIPLCQAAVQQQAQDFYAYLEEKNPTGDIFLASRGWFHRYRERYSLHNVRFSGESASADHDAARNYPPELRAIIREKNLVPSQILNADETGLYWKKMPSRTYLTKEEKVAPGLKKSIDRLTLLLCANASGNFKCKPMLVYRAETPRALKGKNKQHLPVFWKSNRTAWVTQIHFKDWFYNSFIPEVKEFLARENLSFKVLLLLDNARGHGDSLLLSHPDVQVVFLPPNTTSIIQPMDQTVISTFKAYYLRRVMKAMLRAVNQQQNFISASVVRSFWQKFSILQCIGFIDESWAEVQQSTLNRAWSKLLPEFVSQLNPIQTPLEIAEELAEVSREVGGEGFEDATASEILELVSPQEENLEIEDLEPIVDATKIENVPDTEEEPPTVEFGASSIIKVMTVLQDIIDEAMNHDPVMSRSMQFKHYCDLAIQVYEELYKDIIRSKKQLRITDYFKN